MKKLFLFVAFASLLTSCSPILHQPIQGQYQNSPYSFYIDKPLDYTWSKVVDVFSQKGFSIATIDKSSGLIVSTEYSFTGSIGYELPSGFISDSTAFVVVSKESSADFPDKPIVPDLVTGNFNIRVKEEQGKSKVSINIVNTKARLRAYIGTMKEGMPFEVKSTGVFEKKIEALLKEE